MRSRTSLPMLWVVINGLLACSTSRSGSVDAGRSADHETSTGSAGGTEAGRLSDGAQHADHCPLYEPVDLLAPDGGSTRGVCGTVGHTCTTGTGPARCHGLGVGMGLAFEECTCNGRSWTCRPRNVSKTSGCPLTPCEAGGLQPGPAPIERKSGILYCSASNTCDTSLWEVCADGSRGQSVDWHCACGGGSWSCDPTPRGDAQCRDR